MNLLFTQSNNPRFLKKQLSPTTPPLKEPVLISNILHSTITNNSPLFPRPPSQLNIRNSPPQPTYTDLNDLKYRNRNNILPPVQQHPLKTSMIGRITTNISNCTNCGK